MSLALQDPLIGTILLQEVAMPPGSVVFNGEVLAFQPVSALAAIPQTTPAATAAPTFSTNTPAPGATVTITEGTYSGSPAPTITGTLTLGGVDVTANMVGLDYTIPGSTADATALVWSETAANGNPPDATQQTSATVTVTAATLAVLSDPVVLDAPPSIVISSTEGTGTIYWALCALDSYTAPADALTNAAANGSAAAAAGQNDIAIDISAVLDGTYFAYFWQTNGAGTSNLAVSSSFTVSTFLPSPQGYVGTDLNTVTIPFDGTLATAANVVDLSLTQDGVAVAIASTAISGSNLIITTTDTLVPVRSISVTYSGTSLTGTGGTAVAGFTGVVTWTEQAKDPLFANQYSNKWGDASGGFIAFNQPGMVINGGGAAGAYAYGKTDSYQTIDPTKTYVISVRASAVTTGGTFAISGQAYGGGASLGYVPEASGPIAAAGDTVTMTITPADWSAITGTVDQLRLYWKFNTAAMAMTIDKYSVVQL